MGRTNKKVTEVRQSKDFKEGHKKKSRQTNQHINKVSYNSLEDELHSDYSEYYDELEFEKFSSKKRK